MIDFEYGSIVKTPPSVPHYYGDIVRVLFVIAGVIVFLRLPFEKNLLPQGVIEFLVAGSFILILLAGLTNPRQRSIALLNVAIASFSCLLFEYLAINMYSSTQDIMDLSFLTRQVLAVDFLVALYFSTKTLRGMFIK